MARWAKKDVDVDLEVEQDETPVRGNAIASGDDKFDKEVEDEIIDRLDRGDVWAWCSVRVKVTAPDGKEGFSNWLGGCSYKNERDFKQPGGYYDDLLKEALEDLNS